MAALCRDCGAEIPPQIGRGRPRVRCEACSPSKVEQRPAPVVKMPLQLPTPADCPNTFYEAIYQKLAEVGQQDSVYAVIALRAADTIDGGVSGSAEAVLLDRVSRNVEMAMKGAPRAASKLDELRQRRERRTG